MGESLTGSGRPSPVSAWAAGLGIVLGLVAHVPPARGHDVWLEPASFRPEPGETVGIDVVIGENFEGEPVPRRPARIVDFWHGDGRSREPVRGVDGVAPAGIVPIPPGAGGWWMVRYVSRPAMIELTPERFARHLESEGLGHLLRGAAGESSRSEPVRERYSRCVGSLLEVGGAAAPLPPPPRDCELILWPVAAGDGGIARGVRARGEGGGRVRLELTRNGVPVAGAVVRALLAGHPGPRIEAMTDARGLVELDLPRDGVWLFKAIHMERLEGDEADWRSWWASLTFEVGGR